jgi:two-component system nitrogen regulation sensor histidine kinase NtrY
MTTIARPPRRFRRRVLVVVLAAAVTPLLAWGLVAGSLFEGVLSLAPPLEALVGRAADAVESGNPALAGELYAAELRLAQAELARRRLRERMPTYFLAALGVSAAVVSAAAWVLGRRLSRPVEALAEGMAHFARGDLAYQVRVPGGRGDEFDFLARELGAMGHELQAQRDRLQVTEQLAAWRDVARAMAHDLRNPLTAMRMALGRLGRPGRSEEATAEAVSLLQQEVDVLIRLTTSFADFAKLPEPVRRPLDLAALVEEVARLYREENPGVPVEVQASERPTILGDADQLRRALGNLVKNALEASGATGGSVEILVAARGSGPVQVLVRDAGVGIAKVIEGGELVRGLGSSKATGRRGLGLPIAQKIFHDHGGRLRLAPLAPRGTEALVELPPAP